MDIGVFDHVDRGGAPLGQFYEDRLAIVEAYDRIGVRGYHIAEHHFTPLGMAASPGRTGLGLFIVVAPTDEEARAIATRAYKVWHANFHYLYHLHGRAPVWGERPNDFQIVVDELRGVAGSPETVRRFVNARMEEAGADYMVGQFVFGDMTREESLASIELFGREVMPGLAGAPAMAAAE